MTDANSRQSEYPIDPMFLNRWSPRAFKAEPMVASDLLTMLDAARWAASSYNSQPWRFIYALRDTAHWPKFLSLLLPFNQTWAKNASALVFLISNSMMRPLGADAEIKSYSHSLDAGTASGYFALQANRMGWFVHGMTGVNFELAKVELAVPDQYRVEAAYAVGKLGDKSLLPEALQSRESPSGRRALTELVFEGAYSLP